MTRIDLHVHTTASSCSVFTPRELTELALAMSLGAVVTTNHHNCTGDAPYLRSALESAGIQYYAGMEITNQWGDFILLGSNLGDFHRIKKRFPVDLLPRPDVAVIWAHPYRLMSPAQVDRLRDVVAPFVDAVEGINGNCLHSCPRNNQLAIRAAQYMNLPVTGGSDAHHCNMFMDAWTEFEEPVNSIIDLVTQIKQGKIRPGVKTEYSRGFMASHCKYPV